MERSTDPYNFSNKLLSLRDINTILERLHIHDCKINDIELYQRSFIHKSYCHMKDYEKYKWPGAPCLQLQEKSYETLEFLGDAILGSVVSSYLFKRFFLIHGQDEGFLTKLKIRIICGENLSKFSDDLSFQEHIIISSYVESCGIGRNNINILEDVFEALIGAIYLDQSYEMAERFIISVIEKYFDFTDILLNDTNYKDQISRYIQKNYKIFPSYKTSIKENNQYHCELYNGDTNVSTGEGSSKKKAEQDASKKALIHYNVLTHK